MRSGRIPLAGKLRWVYGKEQRSRAYYSFRDAVLLLRDLVSDLRAQEQFVNIGTTMATIMDEDVQWNGRTENNDRQQVDDYYHTHIDQRGAATRMKERSQIMRQMMKNDWISNIWVMVDTGKSEAARELSDTQSDFNFVSYQFLVHAGVDLTKMEPAPAEEIQGIVQGVTFKPKYQIVLSWVREKGKIMHKSKFLVVGEPDEGKELEDSADPDFDIIISKAETARYFRQGLSAFTAASRKRIEDELKLEQEARAKKEKEEAEKERKQLIEDAKAKKEAKQKTAKQ